MKKILLILALLFISLICQAQLLKQKEVYYEGLFSKVINGTTQVVLKDLSRVDIVTDTFAIEIDFADKWAESVGQSLYYAHMLDRKPGVLLIVNGNAEERYVLRLLKVAEKEDITVWLWNYNNDTWKRTKISSIYSYKF